MLIKIADFYEIDVEKIKKYNKKYYENNKEIKGEI